MVFLGCFQNTFNAELTLTDGVANADFALVILHCGGFGAVGEDYRQFAWHVLKDAPDVGTVLAK